MPSLRVDDQELFGYVRVHPDDGFDPLDNDFLEPQFSDTAIGVGQPLISVLERNRELAIPVHFQSRSDDVTNLASDTSAESGLIGGTAGWSQNDPDMPTTVEASPTHATDGYYAWHVSATNALGPTQFPGLARNGTPGYIPVTAGSVYSMGIDYDCVSITTANKSLNLLFRWFQSDRTTSAGADSTSSVTLANGSKGRLTCLNKTAPAGAAFVNIICYVASAVVAETVDYWLDRFMMVQGATLPEYIDGDYPGCKWDGPRFDATSSTYVGKDGLHELITAITRELATAQQVVWRDADASYATYYKVQFARFEPSYNYRRSQSLWASGIVRIWVEPFGHTGTHRVLGTAVSTGISAQIPVASIGGEQLPDTIMYVSPAAGSVWGPAPDGRIVGVAAVPTGYVYDWAAASLNGSLVGASGYAGSQYIRDTSARTIGQVLLTQATPYAGRNRIIAIVQGDGEVGIDAYDDFGTRLGGGIPSARPDEGLAVVDMGVLPVDPSSGRATHSIQFVRGASYRDEAIRAYGAASPGIRINRVLLLPEDNSQLAIDTARKLVSQSVWGSAGRDDDIIADDIGQTMFASPANLGLKNAGILGGDYSGAIGLATTLGQSASQLYMTIDHPPKADLGIEVFGGAFPTVAASQVLAVGKVVDDVFANAVTFDRVWLRAHVASLIHTAGSSVLVLSMYAANAASAGIQNVASLIASKSLFGLVTPSNALRLRMRQRGNQVDGELWLHAQSYAAGSPVGSISASIGAIHKAGRALLGLTRTGSTSMYLRGQRVWSQPSLSYGGTSRYRFENERTIREAAPSVFSQDVTSLVRGQSIKIYPGSHAGVVAFHLPLDGEPANESLAVDVRVRERFTYVR